MSRALRSKATSYYTPLWAWARLEQNGAKGELRENRQHPWPSTERRQDARRGALALARRCVPETLQLGVQYRVLPVA